MYLHEAWALHDTSAGDVWFDHFKRIVTPCLQDLQQEFLKDEKFIGRELRGAIDYIEDIESKYKEPSWLQRLSQTLHLPFASQSVPKQ